MTVDVAAAADVAAGPPRRRPAWVPTVAAFATIALCLTAASWQHRRMLEKEALQQQFAAAAAAPAVPLPSAVTDWSGWRFRTVTLTGEFDAQHQILIDNVLHGGRVGFDVVTPFVLDDGRKVLVDRGFVAGGATRAILPSPAVPRGGVTLHGRIDLPSLRYLELGTPALPAGPLWQHVDPRKFAQATGIDVLPIVVKRVGPPGDGLAEDDTLPDTGIDKHLSYMLQWLTFAAMAAGLWLWFAVRPWLRRSSTR